MKATNNHDADEETTPNIPTPAFESHHDLFASALLQMIQSFWPAHTHARLLAASSVT